MTYDFILTAQHNKSLMKRLKEAVSSGLDCEINTGIQKIHFNARKQTVIVKPFAEKSNFNMKIIPKEIKYETFLKMLDGDWDNINPNDITDI